MLRPREGARLHSHARFCPKRRKIFQSGAATLPCVPKFLQTV
jgi:hypothetical protein